MLEFVNSESPDILCISETWLSDCIPDEQYSLPGYRLFRKDRDLSLYEDGIFQNKARGGVLAYVKEDLNPTEHDKLSTNIELLWIKITPSINTELLVGVCYRPELAGTRYVDLLCDAIHEIDTQDVILMGDFNFRDIDWEADIANSKCSDKFLNAVRDNLLQQLVDTPTRTKYINDLVIVGNKSIVQTCEVGENFGTSDHKIIRTQLQLVIPKVALKTRKVYLYSKGKYADFDKAVSDIDWKSVLHKYQTINQKWYIFKQILQRLVDEHIPSKTMKRGYVSKAPWSRDPQLKQARKKRRKAAVAFKKSGLNADEVAYQNSNEMFQQEILTAKRRYEQKLAENIKTDNRKFYNYAKHFTRPQSSVDTLEHNGKLFANDIDKAEILNKFFASVMVDEPESLPHLKDESPGPDSCMYDFEFSETDVINIMSKLNPGKAVGPDGIHPNILKMVLSLACPLYILFRHSLDNGMLPDDWKRANICALHKKGSRKSPNNYRPVSLTSQVVKIFERIVLKHVMSYCQANNILSCEQHGFRSKCSCLTNLLECFNDWSLIYDEPNTGIDIIYTDFRKAFDSVPHNRLLQKLSSYGIRGNILSWFKAFLVGRQQRVILNGSFSRWSDVISGVPQGTILGPLCFLLFINDLPTKVSSKIKLFADDCKLYRKINTRLDCHKLQEDLDQLSAWSKQWLLDFSVEKCSVLRVKPRIDFPYFIKGERLSEVDQQKDLGITVSNDLKPSKHIASTIKKANQKLGMIKRCFSNRSPEVITNLYTALIRPILEYCSPAWNPWLKKDIEALEKTQRRCEKLCHSEIRFPRLSDRRKAIDLKETYKILNNKYLIKDNSFFNRNKSQLRGHSDKLLYEQYRTDIRKHLFANRVISDWNRLPQKAVSAQSTDAFRREVEPYIL